MHFIKSSLSINCKICIYHFKTVSVRLPEYLIHVLRLFSYVFSVLTYFTFNLISFWILLKYFWLFIEKKPSVSSL